MTISVNLTDSPVGVTVSANAGSVSVSAATVTAVQVGIGDTFVPATHGGTHSFGGSDQVLVHPAQIDTSSAENTALTQDHYQYLSQWMVGVDDALANIDAQLGGNDWAGYWIPSENYSIGNVVVHKARLWRRVGDPGSGYEPSASSNYWQSWYLTSRLDSKAGASHTHGNISNAGAIGSTSGLPIVTGEGGALQAGSFGNTSGSVCQGNDARLSDSRTPTGTAGGDLTGNYPSPSLATTGVTAGTYKSVTVDAKGRVTGGSNPTTLSGYGITDAASSSHTHTISATTGLQAALDAKAALNEPTFSNLVTFITDNATTTTINGGSLGADSIFFVDTGPFSRQRSPYTNTERDKLAGIASNATANSTDAQLRDRSTHTGTQPLSTLSQSGATTNQVVQWNGTAWVAGTVSTYTLPAATTSALGGVIVGTGLGVTSGTVSVTYGTTAGTSCQGNDSRLSDSRAPSGAAGGDLTGTYPNPTIAASAVTYAKMQNVSATDRILGRSTTGAGAVEEITCTAFGRSLIDDADAGTARGTLGLATVASSGSASDLTSGTIATARLGSGTASASTYLRGDQTWASISTYTLPAATTSTLGGVIVGTGLGVTSGTVSVTYGTTAGTSCQGNDSRLSNARTPTAHAASHASGGSDAVTLSTSQIQTGEYPGSLVALNNLVDSINETNGWNDARSNVIECADRSHSHAASDIASGTISAARLGSGTASASTYLRGDQTWAAVPGGGSGGGSSSASDLTSGTLANARLTTRIRCAANIYLYSSFR